MANMIPSGFTAYAGMKRHREGEDEGAGSAFGSLYNKKIRPTINPSEEAGHYDSVLSTPTNHTLRPNYDSDDQSSMVSEPGSPQDYAESHSSGDDDMEVEMESALFSPAAASSSFTSRSRVPMSSSSPWRHRAQGSRDRVATPFGPSAARPASRALQLRTGTRASPNHIRSRHPQENTTSTITSTATTSDHLEVPSPIDEDEARTPPSAADVTGSQLSMLSVTDMDIEPAAHLPSITINPARDSSASPGPGFESQHMAMDDSTSAVMMDDDDIPIRKQRQRSGAQSHGSVSPARGLNGSGGSGMDREMGGVGGKRGFSMGYRADCVNCQMRVPGHMNHFVA